jgi:DNA processing protein
VSACAISPEEELHWLALRLVPGLGTLGSIRLVEQFHSPVAIFRSSTSDLVAAGLSGATARSISSGCSFDEAVQQQEKLRQYDTKVITLHDPLYPPQLRAIFDPPLLLFARGNVDLLLSPSISVVGTRRPTPYGIAATERLSADLAQAGLTITSGMARGVDTAAHKAALSSKGNTIAVFGCGVDVLYPADNRHLRDEIALRGLIISEFPLGAPAYPQNFPIRNRIVSGLALGVLVIEGAQHSGSAITARLAVEQGKDVFAIPGNITSKMSWAPNLLIKQGTAKLVQEWSDVVNELPADVRRSLVKRGQKQLLLDGGVPIPEGEEKETLAPIEILSRKLLSRLQVDVPQSLDDLFESFDAVSSSELIAALFDLEMNGLVRQLPGRTFVKVW